MKDNLAKKIIVTGGAGFIGTNLTVRLLRNGHRVTLLDNFSRKGTLQNLGYIKETFKNRNMVVEKVDIRDFPEVCRIIMDSDVIYHLASQVAVTSSIKNPREDFEINILGTLNILEAARRQKKKPIIIYSSTNKVYGDLRSLKIKEKRKRYVFDKSIGGIDESFLPDYHTPYGCSKGASEAYLIDYHRLYGIPTVVFRQSCIYGPHQMGNVDQGWLAHIAIRVLQDKHVTIFGNGKQIRDLLYIDDLVDAYENAITHIKISAGRIYNIGGGLDHSFSILEYIDYLESLLGRKIKIIYKKERPGDQKIYISNTKRIKKELSWDVKICHYKGLEKMISWLSQNQDIFANLK